MACPDHDELCDFVARTLDVERAAAIEAHFADCDDCRTLVYALVDDTPGSTTTPRIGRFEVLDVIGQGAMGVVYRAHDGELDRIVAIKVRRGTARLNAEREERLRREARALARLTHPNVVSVYESGVHDGMAYVVMEYVDGVTLDTWLRERRSVEERLARMIEAGRGLAAAHAAGLIHRDFKPHNVFVSKVAKVGDFGLARIRRAAEHADAEHDDGAELTMTLSAGTMIGTPAYMAPEQLAGGVATEASDQFSFCVTLYESLFGTRPFRGDSIRELVAAMEVGVTVPSSSRVVRSVLERGLDRDPARRFATMSQLLDVLDRRRRPRWPWVAGVGGAIAVAGALVIANQAGGSAPCSSASEHVRAVWSVERAAAIERAFTATRLPYAADTARHVRGALDSYTTKWADVHRGACEAARRGETSARLLDARMQCLEYRLDDVRALTAVFATADAGAVRRATRAVDELAPVERCLDLELANVRVPADPATRTAVGAVRRDIAAARAELNAGRFDKAVASGKRLVDRARQLGYQPLIAEAMFLLGDGYTKLEDADNAARALEEAARGAYAARDDERAAQAWVALIYVAAYQRKDLKAGAAAAEMARAALARIPHGDPRLLTELLGFEAVLLHERGEYRAAREKYREALALATRTLPPNDDNLATLRTDYAITLSALDARDEALQVMREAIAIRERGLGPLHPDTASTRGVLGNMLAALGRHAEAIGEFDHAIGTLEQTVGRESTAVAAELANSCSTLEALGRADEALARAQRALTIFKAKLGESHSVTATAMSQVATMLASNGRSKEAIPLYRSALAIQEKQLGPDHPKLSGTLDNLGYALLDVGDAPAAIPLFERARTIVERALGRDHMRTMYPLLGLSQAYLDRGDAARASSYARRAMALQEHAGAAPAEQGQARFLLAKASWKLGDRKAATALAQQALDDYKDLANERATVETWLKHH